MAMTGRVIGSIIRLPRVADRGGYRIAGTVRVDGAPASRLVRLFEFPSFRLVDAVWSDHVTGVYLFERINERPQGGATWAVFAHDHTGQFDPEAKVELIAGLAP